VKAAVGANASYDVARPKSPYAFLNPDGEEHIFILSEPEEETKVLAINNLMRSADRRKKSTRSYCGYRFDLPDGSSQHRIVHEVRIV